MKQEFPHNWYTEFAAAITICDKDGSILYMNDASKEQFKDEGDETLQGTNVLDCHPEPSKTKLKRLIDNKGENMYTTEKIGRKKFIYQGPWIESGEYMGIIEISFDLPADIKHIVRL